MRDPSRTPTHICVDGTWYDLDAEVAARGVPGLTRNMLYQRLKRGTAVDIALLTPPVELVPGRGLARSLLEEALALWAIDQGSRPRAKARPTKRKAVCPSSALR